VIHEISPDLFIIFKRGYPMRLRYNKLHSCKAYLYTYHIKAEKTCVRTQSLFSILLLRSILAPPPNLIQFRYLLRYQFEDAICSFRSKMICMAHNIRLDNIGIISTQWTSIDYANRTLMGTKTICSRLRIQNPCKRQIQFSRERKKKKKKKSSLLGLTKPSFA